MTPGLFLISRHRGMHCAGVSLVAAIVLSYGCNARDSERKGNDSSLAVTPTPAATTGADRESGSCPVDGGGTLITAKGIGAAQLGMPLADLKKICTVRDSALRAGEGQPANAYVISVGSGSASLLIFVDDAAQTIRHAATTDSVFRTSAAIGVGSTVGDLRRGHDRLCGGLGPTGIEVWPASLHGVVFGTTAYPPKMPGGGTGLARDARAVPDSAHVTTVAVSAAVRSCSK